jgi:uncharacterized protein YdiU (UPF0061 family)
MAMRYKLIEQYKQKNRDPDVMMVNKLATTCRVAPSFLRVGHIELHGRRARKGDGRGKEQLLQLVEHALFREYPEVAPGLPVKERVLPLARAFSQRIATLTANWIRVGYCQGNFNSDNCLVGGRTMDYGPFGFIEKFKPLWNMWSGGGEHFGFLNQPLAGSKNFESFATAVSPLLDEKGQSELKKIVREHKAVMVKTTEDMWRQKLGLSAEKEVEGLLEELLGLMDRHKADYTLVWRTLADVAALKDAGASEAVLLAPLQAAFYKPLKEGEVREWAGSNGWIPKWFKSLEGDGAAVAVAMKRVNPKVPLFPPWICLVVVAIIALICLVVVAIIALICLVVVAIVEAFVALLICRHSPSTALS